jgi:trehalose-6-phosphate synthase
MSERSQRAEGLKKAVTERNPGDWINDQLADIARRRELRSIEA